MIHRIDRVNPDVDDRVIKPNEARMASNLRFGASTEDTNLSGGTLVLGNKEVPFTPPSGAVNKVVGVYADLETNCVFFALYNSDTKHGIFRINGATNAVDTIIGVDVLGNNQGAFLNFQPQDTYNVSIAVIQGLLYWTDNLNEPGVINIEKGIRTMSNTPLPGDSSSVYHAAFADTNFLQVKRPPAALLGVYRIETRFGTSLQPITFTPAQIQSIFTNDSDLGGTKLALWKKNFVNTDGIHFSYYYVYDNNEESKLAPWTGPVFWKKNIVVQVPNLEVNNFLARNTTSAPTFQPSTVKRVVFVYRVNNDGVPFVMGSVNNTQTNYLLPRNQPAFSSSPLSFNSNIPVDINLASLRMLSADTTSLIRTPVSTDIAEQRFDSVPLKSATNTIAQNRLNHANYILDRNSWQGMTLSLQVVPVAASEPDPQAQIVDFLRLEGLFRPGGTYEIGIELLDKAGRPIGVIANQEITIPQMRVTSNPYKYTTSNGYNAATLNRGNTPNYNSRNYKDANNLYRVNFTVTGALPPWAASFRIVSSGDKQASFFYRNLTQIYYWFQSPDGVNIPLIYQFLAGAYTIPADNPIIPKPNRLFQPLPDTIVLFIPGNTNTALPSNARTAAFKGYAIAKGTIPVSYNEGDELYIKIGAQRFPAYLDVNSEAELLAATVNNQIVPIQEYKIVGEENGLFFIEATDTSLYPTVPEPGFLNPQAGNNFNSYASTIYWWDTFKASEIYIPVYYDIEVYKKKTVEQTVFYQNSGIIPASSYNNNSRNGTVQGDCYVTAYTSTITPQGTQKVGIIPYITGDVTDNPSQVFNKVIPPSNAWYETRTIQFNALTNVPGIFYSMNPNSYNTEEWTWQKGQPAIVNENQREVRIDNGIIFSSPLVQGTQINGLNQFNSLDFRLSPVENGPISSLVVTNATQKEPGVMLAIGANGVSSFYYDAIQLTNVDGTDNVATTTSYLASQRPLLGQYGTTRQMSITKTPLGAVYWWSDVVNDLIRYTNAGLERLGMTFSFANYLRKTYNDNALLFTWYDQVTDEILLCGKLRETSVFSERYKTFQGERSYKNFLGRCPERGIGLATKQFLFLEGKIWVTDVDLVGLNAPPNNFIFNEFKDPLLNIVTNESPANVKRWNQIKVFGSRPGSVELQAPDETEGLSGVLESTLDVGNWIKRKGDWEAAIRRAANTPGGLLAGKLMESRILYSKFAFGADGFQKLNFIEIKSNVSIVQ
jgi:hypothetical protein